VIETERCVVAEIQCVSRESERASERASERPGERERKRNACIARWLIRQPIMRLGVSRYGRIADSSAETSVITSSLK